MLAKLLSITKGIRKASSSKDFFSSWFKEKIDNYLKYLLFIFNNNFYLLYITTKN